MLMAPMLVLTTFGILFWFEYPITLSIAFASIQMFGNLEHPIQMIPRCIKAMAEFNLSAKRIYEFLTLNEIHPSYR